MATANQVAFAKALTRELPGLNYTVALAWTTAEVGSNNNLGIMRGPGKPASYATPEQGAAAAAALIRTSPYYSGIMASLAGGSPQQQAMAIAQSPWHLGPTGLRNAGGTDPYYARIFSGFGFTFPSTPGAVTINATLASSPSGTQTLADALGLPADQKLSLSMATDPTTLAKLAKLSGERPGDIGAYLVDFVNHPLGTIPFVSTGQGSTPPGTTFQGTPSAGNPLDVAGAIGTGVDKLIQGLSFVAALVVILAGIWLYAKGRTENMQAEPIA